MQSPRLKTNHESFLSSTCNYIFNACWAHFIKNYLNSHIWHFIVIKYLLFLRNTVKFKTHEFSSAPSVFPCNNVFTSPVLSDQNLSSEVPGVRVPLMWPSVQHRCWGKVPDPSYIKEVIALAKYHVMFWQPQPVRSTWEEFEEIQIESVSEQGQCWSLWETLPTQGENRAWEAISPKGFEAGKHNLWQEHLGFLNMWPDRYMEKAWGI